MVIQGVLDTVPRSLGAMMAAWLPPAARGLRREAQVRRYFEQLHDAGRRAAVLASCTPAARALLAIASCRGGERPLGELIEDAAAAGHDVTLAAVGEAHRAGLLFIENPRFWPGRAAVWTRAHNDQLALVPSALAECAGHVPGAPMTPPVAAEAATPRPHARQPALVDLIEAFFQCVTAKKIKTTQEGRLTVRALRCFEERFAVPLPGAASPLHPAAILAFARAAGLVRVDSTGTVIPAARCAAFRRATRAEQARVALLHAAAAINDDERLARYGFSPLRLAHRLIMAALSRAQQNAWIPTRALAAAIARRVRHVFSAAGAPRDWTWTRIDQPLPEDDEWAAIVGAHVGTWLTAAGVVETGVTASGADAFRPTAFGSFCVHDQARTPAVEHTRRLVVQSDYTALLTHSGPWDPLSQALTVFAARTGDDNASVFRFSRQSVQNAVQHGHTISELIDAMDQAAAYPVPGNVRRHLEEWGAAGAAAVFYRDANLFTFDTEDRRDAFIGKCHGHDVTRIGASHALVHASDQAVLDLMSLSGATPVDYTQPPVAGIEIGEQGELALPANGDFRVMAVAEAISEPAAAVTPPERARRMLSWAAMKRCNEPEQALDRLSRLPGRPLSLNVRLNLLVGFGLMPLPRDNEVTLATGIGPAERRLLGSRGAWRRFVAARLDSETAVIKPDAVPDAVAMLADAGFASRLQRVRFTPLGAHGAPGGAASPAQGGASTT
ncbi:hypothetical protein GX586_06000 [bacterium]|nr:hypothetical protein [bacterium]